MKYIDAYNLLKNELKNESEVRFVLNELTHREFGVNDVEVSDYKIRKILKKYKKNIPLQYVFRKAYFIDLEIKFPRFKKALIPRAETETLTKLSLDYAKKLSNPVIFDFGTGSGQVALYLSKNLEHSTIYAFDIDVKNAKLNCKNEKNIVIIKKDIVNNFTFYKKADLIVSNPPYIPDSTNLPENVKMYEPKNALFGGENGYELPSKFITSGLSHLKKGGRMFVEHFEGQEKYFSKKFSENYVCDHPDLNNIYRFSEFCVKS